MVKIIETVTTRQRWTRPSGLAPGRVDLDWTPMGVGIPTHSALWALREDFNDLVLAAGGGADEGWHEDAQSSPGIGIVSLSLDPDGPYGVGIMSTGDEVSSHVHYQYATGLTVLEPVTMAAGKRLWISVRFKIEDADQNLLMFGLHEAQDDPWLNYPNDSFLIRTTSSDPDGLVLSASTLNSAIQDSDAFTIADDTWYTAEAYFDGATTAWLRVYNDAGELLSETSMSVDADHLPTSPMTVAFGVDAVDTGADQLSIDFIEVAQDRYTGAL